MEYTDSYLVHARRACGQLFHLGPCDDPHVKTSGDEFTQGIVITYLDDLLLTGWQHHIDAITKALLEKYVMKRSGSLPYAVQGRRQQVVNLKVLTS